MFLSKYICKSLILHDTFTSDLLIQHRKILSQLSVFTQEQILPVYPLHCQFETELSLAQLKSLIKKCILMPPEYKNGIIFRPLKIELLEEKITFNNFIFPEITEAAFIIGVINSSTQEISDKISFYFNSLNIQPKSLRVFRIYEAQYNQIDIKNNQLGYSWELGDYTWVKLKNN